MKQATRRIGVVPICVAALTMLCTTSALAQFAQSRPITIIIGVPAGGGADAVARLIGPKLTEALGQPVVVEPRPGANYLNSVTCQKSQIRFDKDQAITRAEREVSFEPTRTQVRMLRQGIGSKPFWSCCSRSAPGRHLLRAAVVRVDANTGKVEDARVQR